MNIGINGYEAVIPRFGFDEKTGLPIRVGSSIYCYELLVHLNRIDKKNDYVIYLPPLTGSDPASLGLPRTSKNWKYVFVKKRVGPWTITGLGLELLKAKSSIDIFFSPTHYLPFFVPGKSVVSILDVSYLHFPQLFKKKDLYQLKFWGKYSIKKAKKIITISESSKSDIIKEYNVVPDKIVVIYPGIRQESRIMNHELSTKDLAAKFGINRKYILFVGTLQPRKNIVRLIEAFSKLDSLDEDLVIVGRKGWMFEEILNAPEKFGISDKVHFLHDVSDEDLPSFYKNALMFVLPSLYEGFGLPVLEAMKYGCPVITSNVSSLPEAGGDAVLYVDPKDVSDITSKMKKLLTDDKLKKELIEKGHKQAEKFSWEKSARETLEVLESL